MIIRKVFLIVFFLLFSLGCERSEEKIKFGAIIPLTGESAFWGKNIQQGINLAVDQINTSGGILGKEIEVIYEDTQGKPTQATSAINKLINVDGTKFIIGDVISTNILAVAPIVERNKVLLIGFGESAEITDAGDYIFRNWNSAATDAEITGQFAAKNSDRLILLGRNDAFGRSAKTLFKEQLEGSDVRILKDINFETNDNDFRTIISSLNGLNYDGIYFAGFHEEATDFLRQYIELNGKVVNIYGVSSWEEKTLIDFIVQNYSGNVYYGYPKPPDPNLESVQKFYKQFEKKYNSSPEILADNGYDAVMMYKSAIESMNSTDVKDVKKGLYELDDFHGATGIFSIDENGDVNKPFGLKVINSDSVKWLD